MLTVHPSEFELKMLCSSYNLTPSNLERELHIPKYLVLLFKSQVHYFIMATKVSHRIFKFHGPRLGSKEVYRIIHNVNGFQPFFRIHFQHSAALVWVPELKQLDYQTFAVLLLENQGELQTTSENIWKEKHIGQEQLQLWITWWSGRQGAGEDTMLPSKKVILRRDRGKSSAFSRCFLEI